jgi:acylphosphatase
MLVAREILVSGKVQGVNFRYHTRQEANRLGIRGTVENLPDGSVLICAEGEDALLELFTAWCRTGPSRAMVTKVSVKKIDCRYFSSFEIIR